MVNKAGPFTVALVLASVSLAGCSGSGNGAGNPTTLATSAAAASQVGARGGDPVSVAPSGRASASSTAQTIAQQAGCNDVRRTTMAGSSDVVHCGLDSGSVDVATFLSTSDRDAFVAPLQAQSSTVTRSGVTSDGVAWAAVSTDGADLSTFGGSSD